MCRATKKTCGVWTQMVGTQEQSQAYIFDSCRFRNSRHPGDSPRLGRGFMSDGPGRNSKSQPCEFALNPSLTIDFRSHLSDQRLRFLGHRVCHSCVAVDLIAKTNKHANSVDATAGPSRASQQEGNCARQGTIDWRKPKTSAAASACVAAPVTAAAGRGSQPSA
jgi:hypothetical protein